MSAALAEQLARAVALGLHPVLLALVLRKARKVDQ